MIDRKTFFSLLSQRFYPVLRAEGFKGSGTTLRRINGELIHIVHVWAERGAAACYIDLGVHLAFLPPEGGLPLAPERLDEPDCAFHGRITSPAGPAYGWSYGRDRDEAVSQVDAIIAAWHGTGHAFFAQYATFPAHFHALLAQSPPDALPHARAGLHLARIALELGFVEQALAYARAALAQTPPQATLLRTDLQDVVARCGAG